MRAPGGMTRRRHRDLKPTQTIDVVWHQDRPPASFVLAIGADDGGKNSSVCDEFETDPCGFRHEVNRLIDVNVVVVRHGDMTDVGDASKKIGSFVWSE